MPANERPVEERFEILPGRAPHRRTRASWCRVSAIGWLGIALGLASVGASSQMIGRPTWWADDDRWNSVVLGIFVVGVFAVVTFVVVWSAFDGPYLPSVSLAGSSFLGVVALVDRDSSPGAAVVTAALAASGVLLAFAVSSGRRQPDAASSDAASRAASSSTTNR